MLEGLEGEAVIKGRDYDDDVTMRKCSHEGCNKVFVVRSGYVYKIGQATHSAGYKATKYFCCYTHWRLNGGDK